MGVPALKRQRSQTTPLPVEQRIVLHVTWAGYLAIGEAVGDQRIRLTYDRGRLEIMTVSNEHEWLKKLMAKLLEMFVFAMNIQVRSGGQTTLRRALLSRGLEPDECFWIQHEPQLRGQQTLDLETDPPPDLALEVEISRSVLDRLSIYAALGVPEVWRYDGDTVQVLVLTPKGDYQPQPTSRALPTLPLDELPRFLHMRHTQGETQMVRAFHDWLLERQPTAEEPKKTRRRKTR